MVELIALIIFVLSFSWIALIIWRKMPILAKMPDIHEGMQKQGTSSRAKEFAKKFLPNEIDLVKWLSKIRVWILKLEKYIDNLLQKTRKLIVQNNGHRPAHTKAKKNSGRGLPPMPPV